MIETNYPNDFLSEKKNCKVWKLTKCDGMKEVCLFVFLFPRFLAALFDLIIFNSY